MGIAYRLVRPELTVKDVIDIRTRNDIRLTTSPFGVTPERYETNPPIYVGKAVAWKGSEGIEDMYRAAAAEYGPLPAGRLKAGLEKAIKISKAYAGVRGTTLYKGKLYPKKCIEQKKWKEEHPEIK